MSARLVPSQHGPAISLDKAIVLIGRHPSCDFVLADSRKISRRHCCIAQVDKDYVIRDLGSMNGVQVNGEKVRESRINNGDRVAIGDAQFVFQGNGHNARSAEINEESLKTLNGREELKEAPAGPKQAPLPSNLSQEFPVAIPEPVEFLEPPAPRNDLDAPTPHAKGVFQLDSGVIELRDISDSGVQ